MADLFNTSLRESFVPVQWKQSNIMPIPKLSNPTKPSECRPVCLTSCLMPHASCLKQSKRSSRRTYCVTQRQYGRRAISLAFYQAGTPWAQSSKSSTIGSVHWTKRRRFTPSSSTTAAYHVEIQAKLHKTRPKTKQLTPSTTTTTCVIQTPASTQCPLCVFKAKSINGLKIHNSKMHK